MEHNEQLAIQGLKVGYFDRTAFQRKGRLTLVLKTGVAGLRHMKFTEEEKTNIREMPPETELKLVREPDNEYDKYAIQVHTMDGLMLGYVTRYKNETIARLMDEGRRFVAFTRELTQDEDEPGKQNAPTEDLNLPYNIFMVED